VALASTGSMLGTLASQAGRAFQRWPRRSAEFLSPPQALAAGQSLRRLSNHLRGAW